MAKDSAVERKNRATTVSADVRERLVRLRDSTRNGSTAPTNLRSRLEQATAALDGQDTQSATAVTALAEKVRIKVDTATLAERARPMASSEPQRTLDEALAKIARPQGSPLIDDVARQIDRATTTVKLAVASVSQQVTQPGHSSAVNLVGSLLFSVLGAALQVLSGPPVLSAGSTVTVRSSTLTMPGTGQTVQADWYFPENADSSTRLIYFQHGFMATGPMYSYTAAYLAEQTNSIVVVPSLSSNLFDANANWIGGSPMQQSVADLFVGERPELTASASAAAGQPVALPTKFVLVGHSLGGSLVTGAAGRMVDNGAVENLEGVVLLDAVDMNDAVRTGLGQLSGANYRPVLNISSERYVWNVFGLVGDELQAERPGQFNGVMLVGGRHIDALQGANPILQFAEYLIAGFSQPQNIEAVRVLATGWINDMFTHTTDEGSYGAPGETIQVPGTDATAVVLPFGSDDPVPATPWDGIMDVILDFLFQFAVYESPGSVVDHGQAPAPQVGEGVPHRLQLLG